ncbi:MAG: hypothetical protein KJZ60_04840 [Ignavibacteriaceae bacterium]|nr:hypothetical protein [Ignavibacteriaceae bacterium]
MKTASKPPTEDIYVPSSDLNIGSSEGVFVVENRNPESPSPTRNSESNVTPY